MKIRKQPNGSLIVPRRAEGDGVIGDGVEVVRQGTSEYQQWSSWLERTGVTAEEVSESKSPSPDVLSRAFSRHKKLNVTDATRVFGGLLQPLLESGHIRQVQGYLGGVYYVRGRGK